MKKINLFTNSAEIQAELSVIHLSGEEPETVCTETRIIFVSQGRLSLFTNAGICSESEEDIFILNSGEKFSAVSDDCVLVSLGLDASLFPKNRTAFFECNSALSVDKDKYYNIKHLLARLVKISSDTSPHPEYLARSVINLLIYELYSSFFNAEKHSSRSQKYIERLNLLSTYINDNYKSNLSLSDVADYAHLSVPYLSTFFDKYFGMSFLSYYTNVRLRYAVSDLMNSDKSIENIALDNGFPDPRAFVSAFRKKYSLPPSVYRKQASSAPSPDDSRSYAQSDYLYALAKYLPPRNGTDETANFPVSQNFSEEKIDLSGAAGRQ